MALHAGDLREDGVEVLRSQQLVSWRILRIAPDERLEMCESRGLRLRAIEPFGRRRRHRVRRVSTLRVQ
jgi:hypothetical protein